MHLRITHQTNYSYESRVRHSVQYLRMTPWNMLHQQVLGWNLFLPSVGHVISDGFNNTLTTLIRSEAHDNLQIMASGEVMIDDSIQNLPVSLTHPMVFLSQTTLTEPTPAMLDFANATLKNARSRSAFEELSAALLQKVTYTPGSTNVQTTAEESFERGQGVCQDHAHLMIGMARALQTPARYVSGYLYDSSNEHLQSHAWAELWIDEAWYTFDVSNQLYSPSRHVYVAFGRDYQDAAPLRGTRTGGGVELMRSEVKVERLA